MRFRFFFRPTDLSPARIQLEDEKPLLNYDLTGNAEDVIVKSRVTDLYGKSFTLPDVKGKRGTLRYLPETGKPYGQFRIEAQAFRNGKAVSVVNEMVVTRLPRPVHEGKDAPESPFGIHMNLKETSIRAMKAGGFNWVRLHDGSRHLSCWYFVEPEKGKWHFADREIQAFRKNHILLYGQLGGSPAWASDVKNLPGFWNSYAKVYFTPLPEHEPDFARYCETMTRRYKGIIDDWFIWNEPWLPLFFHRSYDTAKRQYRTYGSLRDNAEAYARLSKLACLGAKKGNPDCRITAFSSSRGSTPAWNAALYAAGGYSFCDEIDYHTYHQNAAAGFPGDGLEETLRLSFREVLRKEGRIRKPVSDVGRPVRLRDRGGRRSPNRPLQTHHSMAQRGGLSQDCGGGDSFSSLAPDVRRQTGLSLHVACLFESGAGVSASDHAGRGWISASGTGGDVGLRRPDRNEEIHLLAEAGRRRVRRALLRRETDRRRSDGRTGQKSGNSRLLPPSAPHGRPVRESGSAPELPGPASVSHGGRSAGASPLPSPRGAPSSGKSG